MNEAIGGGSGYTVAVVYTIFNLYKYCLNQYLYNAEALCLFKPLSIYTYESFKSFKIVENKIYLGRGETLE